MASIYVGESGLFESDLESEVEDAVPETEGGQPKVGPYRRFLEELEPLTTEKLLIEQFRDAFCMIVRGWIDGGQPTFLRDDTKSGLLKRYLYDHPQIVVTEALEAMLLHFAHAPVATSHTRR